MSTAATIRRFAPDEWRTYRDLRLRALADAPEAFGATLADEHRRSEEEWRTRLASSPSVDLPLLAEVGGLPVGLAWGRIETPPDTAHVYQMWVEPAYRRMGIGQSLLKAIIDWATDAQVRWLDLGVTTGNTAAMRLYLRAGFEPVGEPGKLWPGSPVVAQPMRLEL